MPVSTARPMTRANFGKLLYPGLSKIFFENYAKPTSEYTKVHKTSTHDEYFKRVGRMMGLGPYRQKDEGDFIQLDAGKWLSEKEIYFPTYALGFGVSYEMLEDDMYSQMEKFSADLGDSANTTKELLSWDVFNKAALDAGSGGRSGLDGKALLANDHVTGDGVTTLDNLTTDSLSLTALEEALDYYENMVNERSEPRPFTGGKLLLIPPELKWKARELLISEYKPELTDGPGGVSAWDRNTINNMRDEDIQYMIIHWLTGTDPWFLMDKEYHDVQAISRREVSFENTMDPKSTDHLYYGTFRFTADFFDYRGAYGNVG